MFERILRALVGVSVLFLLPVAPMSGQALKGTILGTVTDQTHAIVPSVSVNLTDVNANAQRTEVTNESGFFAFANLDPGTYRIEIKHPVFRRSSGRMWL